MHIPLLSRPLPPSTDIKGQKISKLMFVFYAVTLDMKGNTMIYMYTSHTWIKQDVRDNVQVRINEKMYKDETR